MPYNPSSAYPRHSTYTPPVYGREFARAFNEPRWGQPIGAAPHAPRADVGHAINAALTPGSHTAIGLGLEAMARRGIVASGQKMMEDKAAERRQKAKTLAAGAPLQQPLAQSSPFPRPEQPEPQFVMNSAERSRGGRKHVGQINERIGDISAREQSTSAVEGVVENILTTGNGGQSTIPKLTSGSRRP